MSGGSGDGGRQGQHGPDGDGGNEGSDGDGQGGDDSSGEGTSTVEKAVIALSVGFTVLLFAYAGWQLATPPETGTPEASVVGTDRLENGSVAVTVRLRNPTDVGLVTATVESNCTSPPPQIQFSYVPAATTRTGTLVCPPDTTDPDVSMANWVSR